MMPSPASGTSQRVLYGCRWGFCRKILPSNADLLNHVILEHVCNASPITKSDLHILQRAELGFSQSFIMSLPSQGHSVLSEAGGTRRAQATLPPDTSTPTFASLDLPASGETSTFYIPPSPTLDDLVQPRLNEFRALFKDTQTSSQDTVSGDSDSSDSQDAVEKQLTQDLDISMSQSTPVISHMVSAKSSPSKRSTLKQELSRADKNPISPLQTKALGQTILGTKPQVRRQSWYTQPVRRVSQGSSTSPPQTPGHCLSSGRLQIRGESGNYISPQLGPDWSGASQIPSPTQGTFEIQSQAPYQTQMY